MYARCVWWPRKPLTGSALVQARFDLSQTQVAALGTAVNLGGELLRERNYLSCAGGTACPAACLPRRERPGAAQATSPSSRARSTTVCGATTGAPRLPARRATQGRACMSHSGSNPRHAYVGAARQWRARRRRGARARRRKGPLFTVLAGILIHCAGYLALHAALVGRFNPSYWALLGIALVAGNGVTWFETAALVTCVRNFETERCACACAPPARPARSPLPRALCAHHCGVTGPGVVWRARAAASGAVGVRACGRRHC